MQAISVAQAVRPDMIKVNWIAGLLALALFTYAQYYGWSLFERDAGTKTARVAGGGGGYHK